MRDNSPTREPDYSDGHSRNPEVSWDCDNDYSSPAHERCNGVDCDCACHVKPTLAQDSAEAERMTYGGRGMPALRHAKTFDHTRLEDSPLFKPTIPKLF